MKNCALLRASIAESLSTANVGNYHFAFYEWPKRPMLRDLVYRHLSVHTSLADAVAADLHGSGVNIPPGTCHQGDSQRPKAGIIVLLVDLVLMR